jgi:hypothetical protein
MFGQCARPRRKPPAARAQQTFEAGRERQHSPLGCSPSEFVLSLKPSAGEALDGDRLAARRSCRFDAAAELAAAPKARRSLDGAAKKPAHFAGLEAAGQLEAIPVSEKLLF